MIFVYDITLYVKSADQFIRAQVSQILGKLIACPSNSNNVINYIFMINLIYKGKQTRINGSICL